MVLYHYCHISQISSSKWPNLKITEVPHLASEGFEFSGRATHSSLIRLCCQWMWKIPWRQRRNVFNGNKEERCILCSCNVMCSGKSVWIEWECWWHWRAAEAFPASWWRQLQSYRTVNISHCGIKMLREKLLPVLIDLACSKWRCMDANVQWL